MLVFLDLILQKFGCQHQGESHIYSSVAVQSGSHWQYPILVSNAFCKVNPLEQKIMEIGFCHLAWK